MITSRNAKRKYKSINVPLNIFEYAKLEEIVSKTGSSKLHAIREAIVKFAAEMGEGK